MGGDHRGWVWEDGCGDGLRIEKRWARALGKVNERSNNRTECQCTREYVEDEVSNIQKRAHNNAPDHVLSAHWHLCVRSLSWA